MRVLNLLPLVLVLLFVSGCQTTQQSAVQVNPHFLDISFSGYESVPVETESEIFELSDEAKRFVFDIQSKRDRSGSIEELISAIFDRSSFNMIYDNSANTTARETFINRSANCLSLSIMTYSLAREAGFTVTFREIEIPEYWTRKNGFSLLNGHINLRISEMEEQSSIVYAESNTMVVDFDPFSPKKYFPSRSVRKNRVLSMFYNNKGADALLKSDYLTAYAYFRAAVSTDSQFQDAWANMGILYRMTGHYDWAENTYHEALKLNPDNLTIMENLAVLHQHQGRYALAKELLAKVETRRLSNPYYHYNLGEQELEASNYHAAMSHYKKAIRLDASHHEFYFGMAKVHALMGDVEQALRYLQRARRKTNIDDLKDHYQHKMDLFAKL
ncbi:tetratricopeptide repeat protein [Planctobacterium marinum]|uniref:tetratricopeptide repeat protein n=1 Tax=Planctobacterium marinum TaxID=1631968 RepID=UPI001E657926|nr:tetratricopeptide repeat protein [Planctobacterium marinum]MCC2608199.1 tetratricopeptide repeat protein [Planctobacterium marinum]